MYKIVNQLNPFLLKTWKGFQKVNPAEIICIEADLSGIRVRLANGQFYESPLSLKQVADMLGGGNLFYPIHRKYLVNLNFISEYIHCDQTITLSLDGAIIKLPVSRRKRKGFIELLKLFNMKEQLA